MKAVHRLVAVGAAVALSAGAAVAVAGTKKSHAVTPLPASSCAPIIQGSAAPDLLIASDLPLQGASRAQTEQMTKAIEFVLKQRGFKAGKYNIGYQSCDDATAAAGKWAPEQCTANANEYAKNSGVVGVIGTFNSGCAAVEIPILNREGLVMISPANTYVGLTQGGAGTQKGEPGIYYSNPKRNYTRVVAADNYQGAAVAVLMKQQGRKRVYILNDKELYGNGVAINVRNAARISKIAIAGLQAWDPKASSYEALANKIKAAKADGVFLGGIIDNNGGKLIRDLRKVLGPKVPIYTPDGFTPTSAVVQQAGRKAAEGVFTTVAGAPIDRLTGAGKAFVNDFGATVGGPKKVEPYSAYAAQAAIVMLDAIAASDGSRSSVLDKVFATKVTGGILGSFGFNKNGDTTNNPVTVYQIKGGNLTTFKVITPSAKLVGQT